MQTPHAIRDRIHGYIGLTVAELRGVDSRAVQRLRGIRQLGLTERVYPGAHHSRFEHALGTLEVVTRLLHDLRGRLGLDGLLTPLDASPSASEFEHLLTVARWCALLHDVGHAPFSHVTESLLPGGGDHERVTFRLLHHGELGEALDGCGERVARDVRHVLDPAAGEEGVASLPPLLDFVRELVTGPVGADRMDYLLRDSSGTGVSYGVFDLERVIHTLEPVPSGGDSGAASTSCRRLRLGIRRGGVLAVEGMLWARFSMFQQVYLHRTRRILDRHLHDFLLSVLADGRYPENLDEYLEWDDARVWELLRRTRADSAAPGHRDAVRILERRHHRALPEELTADDPGRIEEWLHDWRERIEAEVPEAQPLPDLVDAPPDLDGGRDLPVLVRSGRTEPLERSSALVGRLRFRPLGRMYVSPGSPATPFVDAGGE